MSERPGQPLKTFGAKLADSRAGRFASDVFAALRAVIHGFRGESINLRAGNLTFISVFSLVPMITVALALLQLLHQERFQGRLLRFLQDVLAPGIQDESAAFLQRFMDAASSTAAGGLSTAFLLISSGMLLRHLDASLNEIWAVRKARPLYVSVGLYAGLLTVGPIALGLWLGGTQSMQRLILGAGLPFSAQMVKLGSAAISVAALTLLYKFAPHAPVRLRSALAGGLVGGIGWELAKVTYASVAGWGFRYNPIYGSLSAAPLFLMWIYVSWWLVLFGARLSYAVEHAHVRGVLMDLVFHPRAKELIGARIAQLVAASHAEGGLPPTPRDIARTLRVPAQMVIEIVHLLEQAGLVVLQRGGLLPAKSPSELTLADVSAAVGGVAKLLRKPGAKSTGFQEVEHLFSEVDDAKLERLKRVSWASLARSAAPPDEGMAEPQASRTEHR